MCFDSSIGFFGVSLQSFLSRVVPLLKIMWIPSVWSSLLKISENPFADGSSTLKDFSKSIGLFCVFSFPLVLYLWGMYFWKILSTIFIGKSFAMNVSFRNYSSLLRSLISAHKSYALKISVLMESVFVTIGTFDFQLMYFYVYIYIYIYIYM